MKSEHDGKCAYVQINDPGGEQWDISIMDATGPAEADYWIVFTMNGTNGDVTKVNKMTTSAPT
jgi:hypothetical protein